MKFEPQTENF